MIQVIQRAISILENVARTENPVSLGELAERVEIGSTTCANIVKELLQQGYLEQDGRGKGYRIGAMAFGLGVLADPYRTLRYVAEPVIQRIAEETGETTLVSVLSGSRKLVVCHAAGRETVRFALERGVFDDIHWTAGGPLLLAYVSEKQKKWIYQELQKRWGANAEALPWLKRLPEAELQAKGAAYFACETPKVAQFAAPVCMKERVVAALGIFVPQFRATHEQRERVIQALVAGAEDISKELSSGLRLQIQGTAN